MKALPLSLHSCLVFTLAALLVAVGAPALHAATINVQDTADASGNCNNTNKADDSLRLAICYANANPGTVIELAAGETYTITIPAGSSPDNNDDGDLDLWGSNTTINGNGAIIQLGSDPNCNHSLTDRVMEITGGSGITINEVTIRCGNHTFGTGGGGLENYGGTSSDPVTLNKVTITENKGSHGGGLWNDGYMTINDSAISNNQAIASGEDADAGGVENDGGTLTLNRCTINDNSTANQGDGGGIRNSSGTTTLNNTTISSNSAARYAGGVHTITGTLTLNNCTVANNSAVNAAGGLRQYGGTLTIENTIVADNTAATIPSDIYGTITTGGYNIIGTTSGGSLSEIKSTDQTDINLVDLKLGPLDANGGYTRTHALTDNTSLAVEAGNNACDAATCTDPDKDQRGEDRVTDADGDGIAICDVGAYEKADFTDVELQIDSTVSEGNSITGTVDCDGVPSQPFTVTMALVSPTTSGDITMIPGSPASLNCDGTFSLTATDDGIGDDGEEVTITVSNGTLSDTKTVTIREQRLYFKDSNGNETSTFIVLEDGGAQGINVCIDPVNASDATIAVTPATHTQFTSISGPVIAAGDACGLVTFEPVSDNTIEAPLPPITFTAAESTLGYGSATVDVTLYDYYWRLDSEFYNDKTAKITVTRGSDYHCQNTAANFRLDISSDLYWIITEIDPSTGGNIDATKKIATVAMPAGTCQAIFMLEFTGSGDPEDYDLIIDGLTATDSGGNTIDYGTPQTEYQDFSDTSQSTTIDITSSDIVDAVCPDNMPGSQNLSHQTFPTSLLIASYDWLANFYDRNASGHTNSDDPNTDNFNKIILKDSNLFPMYTATMKDTEFPNITSRNTDNLNDYMNRSVSAVANYLNYTTDIPCGNFACKIKAMGMRSHMEWVFVTDPANHNIRRYQFTKHKGFYHRVDEDDEDQLGEDYRDAGAYCDTDEVSINQGDCLAGNNQGNCLPDPMSSFYVGDISYLLDNNNNETDAADVFVNQLGLERVIFFCRDSGFDYPTTDGNSVSDDIVGGNDGDLYTLSGQQILPIIDYKIQLSESELPSINAAGYLPVQYVGIVSDASGLGVWVGINGKCTGSPCSSSGNHDARTDWSETGTTKVWQRGPEIPNGADELIEGEMVQTFNYQLPSGGITKDGWDLDGDPNNGIVEIRLSMTASKNGGLVIGYASLGSEDRQDRGFGVNMGDDYYFNYSATREARWNDIGSYLATVPPKSYRGYTSFQKLDTMFRSAITDSPKPNIGYGFTTNTSFDTAEHVRFSHPRDIAAFRDYFDHENGAPVYLFVADTMNSRIQVFMNATGSAGKVGAPFPIRPVRVKGPNDTTAATAYKSNELGRRIYENTSSVAFGDGRKADWRQSFVHYTSGGSSFIHEPLGAGEFFYPHSIAVDQDPDTKDVYLFVADTHNHRIQVFRNTTALDTQPITDKRFKFDLEAAWGTYPINTTLPGPFAYRYPKGLDVARFDNNSSYLYVADSKNHRLLKYLITESGGGGFSSITTIAGYGYNGSAYSTNLKTARGTAVTGENTTVGFLNPQDVATGYDGFFMYTSLGGTGIKFLDNHMVYVTDSARNSRSVSRDELNMRVQQFVGSGDAAGNWIEWDAGSQAAGQDGSVNTDQGILGGIAGNFGVYNAEGSAEANTDNSQRPGPAENAAYYDGSNVQNEGKTTDRPVGIATAIWNTTEPVDIRVIVNNAVKPNGSTIAPSTAFVVGASSGRYFWFPESDVTAYSNYSTEMDGRRVGRVHKFCYDANGNYVSHSSDPTPTYNFTSCAAAGTMKIVVEDVDFKYGGRTGTQIFKIGN